LFIKKGIKKEASLSGISSRRRNKKSIFQIFICDITSDKIYQKGTDSKE
jgi:hypothetical protein